MSRLSSVVPIVAMILAIIILTWETMTKGSVLSMTALLLFVIAIGMKRGPVVNMAVFVLGLGMLTLALVRYFRTYQVWPFLPMIALATLMAGLGLIRFSLDRYRVPEDADQPL